MFITQIKYFYFILFFKNTLALEHRLFKKKKTITNI
jgi:hypothetical protein